jgi:predicted HicB family RNase H-like nuclease
MSEILKNKILGLAGLDDDSELARKRGQLNIRFSEKSRAQLVAISKKWGMSMSQVVRQLIAEQYGRMFDK